MPDHISSKLSKINSIFYIYGDDIPSDLLTKPITFHIISQTHKIKAEIMILGNDDMLYCYGDVYGISTVRYYKWNELFDIKMLFSEILSMENIFYAVKNDKISKLIG